MNDFINLFVEKNLHEAKKTVKEDLTVIASNVIDLLREEVASTMIMPVMEAKCDDDEDDNDDKERDDDDQDDDDSDDKEEDNKGKKFFFKKKGE